MLLSLKYVKCNTTFDIVLIDVNICFVLDIACVSQLTNLLIKKICINLCLRVE